MERTVTVTVGDESMREVVENVLDGCNLKYQIDGDCVKIK
jgi:hypothetical protein